MFLPIFTAAFGSLVFFPPLPAVMLDPRLFIGSSKTGEIVCSLGSTAGILFYGDSITYPDNTIEAVTYNILPYPVFRGGKKSPSSGAEACASSVLHRKRNMPRLYS